jgi:asparagine synthase (glutamine-hydrolysing)
MCGILVHLRVSGRAAPLDLGCLRHRGPDSAGEWSSPDGRCWLGATRLAIVDLSPAGAQPMTDPQTNNVIVQNGEIYNHRELRDQLGDIAWRGTSDTETLLQAYGRWGHEVVNRVRGMFAFAIYDPAKQELFVARDRLGIKPLYYLVDPDGIRLASEVRALMPDGECTTAGRISAYLQWGASPERKLLYRSVSILAAGHAMLIHANGERRTWTYWPNQKFRSEKSDKVPARIRSLLEHAVEEHLLSDVPIASFLSGGIDSSIVTALAAQKIGKKLHTFSVGFDDASLDESAIALEVAKRFGTGHHAIQLSEEKVIESVTEAVAKMDLPSADAINTYIVSKAVAQHGIKVALSGLGGDELFGGYTSFLDVPKLQVAARFPLLVRRILGAFGSTGQRLAEMPATTSAAELARWRRRFFTDAALREAELPNGSLPSDLPTEFVDDYAAISWAELSGYMRRMLLRDADQMSMAVSLELRVPFLDHELVEYVLGLPASEKQRYRAPKGLLIESCRDLLPASVYQRPKQGFVLPMKAWMTGPLQQFADEGLREVVSRELLPRKFVDDLNASFKGNRLHWTRLWTVVVLGHFAKRRQLCRTHENPALESLA